MEDAKIDLIAREVLSSLRKSRAEAGPAGSPVPPVPAASHESAPSVAAPSRPAFHLHILSVEGGVIGSPCVIEPDKICDGSERCRSLGH